MFDWKKLRSILVSAYGEDRAHDALLALLKRQECPRNPLAYCHTVAKRKALRDHHRALQWVHLSEKEQPSHYTTESIVIAREELTSLPSKFFSSDQPYKAIARYRKKRNVAPY